MKVEGHPEFVRQGSAIVNTDVEAYQDFINQNLEKKRLENRVQSLEEKLTRILNILESGYGSDK